MERMRLKNLQNDNQPPEEEPRVSKSTTPVNLRDVRALRSVIALGSISSASRELEESKGSVSRRISRLEAALGTALIDRRGGRAKATESGSRYCEEASQALDLLDLAASDLKDNHASPRGHLRVTALPGIGSVLLGAALGEFLQVAPGVTVEMLLTERMLSFREDRIDCAFRTALHGLPDSGHIAHKLMPLPLLLVASPAYLARAGAPELPKDLEQHTLIVPPVTGGAMTLTMSHPELGTMETRLPGRLVCHDPLLLTRATVAGGGIMAVFSPLMDKELASGELVPVLQDWSITSSGYLTLVHPSGPISPKLRVFKDFMRARFVKQQSRVP